MDPVAVRPPPILAPVEAPEDVGAVRRRAGRLGAALGGSEAQVGRLELIVTELGTNLLAHAPKAGYLIVQPIADPDRCGVEVLSVDRGPGVRDLARALSEEPKVLSDAELALDPFRRRGLGCGLSGVKRQATEFDIYTVPARGTVIAARLLMGRAPLPEQGTAPVRPFAFGVVSLPVATESCNGDGWTLVSRGSRCTVLVVDGLGHGPGAAQASQAAIASFERNPDATLEQALQDAHVALRPTRGAAAAICEIRADEGKVRFAGVGNVEGRLYFGHRATGLVPRNGTLGLVLRCPTINVREEIWQADSLLVLHSDGLRNHFDFSTDPGLPGRDPAVVAAVLHRDLARPRDDATVVVIANRQGDP